MRRETHTTASTSLTSQELRDIVAAASTFAERLRGDVLADEMPGGQDMCKQKLETWCQAAATGNRERLQEILSWDGYTLADVEGILGPVHLHERVSLPDWTATLQEVLQAIEVLSDKQ